MSERKRYLGDGAYVDFDGFALILTAEDGRRATDTVVLEPEVWAELVQYVADLKAAGPSKTAPSSEVSETNPEPAKAGGAP